eukprot:CAMPEP_0172613962 /NCGR_PEP_ID=MMETSP1068-20121228/49059_1 /TAXON_ID=35684 /ORGANISM="Pseudopedinella elastica, Strain CCMP716" /LENGTH=50 /DNA_ID=CAMNT_0013418601 /DNA_START=133 /DNA_END=282 /DNA_ORIENTATION=-
MSFLRSFSRSDTFRAMSACDSGLAAAGAALSAASSLVETAAPLTSWPSAP